jgi:hypothetical protein
MEHRLKNGLKEILYGALKLIELIEDRASVVLFNG